MRPQIFWPSHFTNYNGQTVSSLIISIFLLSTVDTVSSGSNLRCQACKDFVESFHKGYESTAKSNFGGGNTDWEETRLGSYSTSETRLVEILEQVCTSASDKDQCHHFAEHNEESIEKWYFHLQKNEPDFEKWLCIATAKVCCFPNTFGETCNPCPGGILTPCMMRGDCDGNGTRTGTGKCRCQKGYSGEFCEQCGKGFEILEQNDTFVECSDINECEDPNICPSNEFCYNTEGAYRCMKCHASCHGCTGVGAAKCRTCSEGYVLVNGTCTDEMEVAKNYIASVKNNEENFPDYSRRPTNEEPSQSKSEL